MNLDESEDEAKPVKSKNKAVATAAPVAVFDDEDEEDDEEDDDEEDDDELEDDLAEELSVGDDDIEDLEGSDDEIDLDEDASEQEDESADENDDGSDVELPSDLSEDEFEPDTLDGLDAFVEQLTEGDKKRKSVPEESEPTQKKRRVLPVTAGPALGEGNDFGLKSSESAFAYPW